MPKLIKNNTAQAYTWQQHTNESLQDADLSQGQHLVPLTAWLENSENWGENVGILIPTDADPSSLSPALNKAPAIAISFGAFADGRGFSLARILREDCDYQGELQAAGSYMQDQLFYLKRCGFDSYVVEDDADIDSMLESLGDFSDSYQASCDEPRPLFRRR